MVPSRRKVAVKVARRRVMALAAAGVVALAAALFSQRRRIAVEFWAARLDRLGDERSIVELREMARESDDAFDALVGGLAHPAPETRALAASALAGFPRARDALVRACSDGDEVVGSQARFALRVLGKAP